MVVLLIFIKTKYGPYKALLQAVWDGGAVKKLFKAMSQPAEANVLLLQPQPREGCEAAEALGFRA